MWNPESYLQGLTDNAERRSAFHRDLNWKQWNEGLREQLRTLLGGFPSSRAELKPSLLETEIYEDHIRERVEITTYDGLRMPMYVLIPRHIEAPYPAVIALHGHGYGSREIVGLEPDGTERDGDPGLHKDFALELARRGFMVIAPDLIGFGDRRLEEDKATAPQKSSCFRIAAHLLMMGQTIAGYRIYETMRAIDYLQTRQEANVEQLGCMGISGGGLVAAFTSALDERIRATVVSGYVNTFQASILKVGHCLDNYIPGISLEAEMPDIIGLIAPRPLFIESGDKDTVFPLAGAHAAIEQLKRIYAATGANDQLAVDFFAGGHEIHGINAYEWLGQPSVIGRVL